MKEINLEKINLKLLFNTRRDLAIAIIFIVSGVLIVLLAGLPQLSTINKINTNLKKEKKTLLALQDKNKKLEDIPFSVNFDEAKKVDEVLPSYNPLLELLNNLNYISEQAEVSITDFEIAPGKIASRSAEAAEEFTSSSGVLKIKIKASGQLENMKQFLVLIEQLSPITIITKMNVSYSQENPSDNIMAGAELELSTSYFNESIVMNVDDPLPNVPVEQEKIFNELVSFSLAAIETKSIETTTEEGIPDPFKANQPQLEEIPKSF